MRSLRPEGDLPMRGDGRAALGLLVRLAFRSVMHLRILTVLPQRWLARPGDVR